MANMLRVCSGLPSAYGSSMIRRSRSTWALPLHRSPRTTSHVPAPLRLAATAATLIGALAGCATRDVPPANTTLPESLRTPPQEVLEDALTAVGETIYNCRRQGRQLAWVGKGSEATLVDGARRNVGTLVPGPRFLAYDGSYVSGRVAAEEIVATDALPWQLIVARRTGAEQGKGRFARVTSVQQVRTRGGLAPQTGCTQQGLSLWVPFSATYLIYRAASAQPLAKPASEDATATPVPTSAPVATPLSPASGATTAAPAAAPAPAASTMPASPFPAAAAPIAAPAASAASTAPVSSVASVSETSSSGVPTFFNYLYLRP